MIHIDLFSGVGMFAYAMRKAGIKTVAFAEPDKFCQRVLRKHHPDAHIYDDVKDISYEQLRQDGILADSISKRREVRGHDKTDAKKSGARGNNERGSGAHDSRVTGTGKNETDELKEDGIITEDVAYAEGVRNSEQQRTHCGKDTGTQERPGRSDELCGVCRRAPSDQRNQPTDVILTGGFPCQDLSVAGKQAGITAERSGLWSEFARIISDLRPRYVIIENVSALLSGGSVVDGPDGPVQQPWFNTVLCDLAEIGCYDIEWHVLPAGNPNGLSAGAPHRRERVWIICRHVADSKRERLERLTWNEQDRDKPGRVRTKTNRPTGEKNIRPGQCDEGTGQSESSVCLLAHGIAARLSRSRWLPEPGIGRVATGVPDRINKLKALGNGLVWQIPFAIVESILECDA